MTSAIAKTVARQLSECASISEAWEIVQNAHRVMRDAGFHSLEINRILGAVPEAIRLLMQSQDDISRSSFRKASEFAERLLCPESGLFSDAERLELAVVD
jgi:hypothetical protein